MSKTLTAGIDVGTHQVKVVITAKGRGKDQFPRIIGTGYAESRGLRHGYIINGGDTARSIRIALDQAEKVAGMRIKHAYLSVGGVGLEEVRSKGETVVSRADTEITELDIEQALEDNEAKVAEKLVNRKIIHVIPIRYKIDGEYVLGKPQGMRGTRLEVETLLITCLEQHLNDLIGAVEEVGVEVEDVMASPIAGGLVTLSKAQKIAGCVLANIGAETVSIVVFEDNVPLSLKVFPIGSTDITNDIALGLKISLEDAEQVKLGAFIGADFSKKKLDEIIMARLSDIFELIEAHLKKIGKSGLLPAGIVLTGGGSGVATIEDLARATLKLPTRTASLPFGKNTKGQVRDSSWAVAYGLCIWGLSTDEEGASLRIAKRAGGSIMRFIKRFLP